MPPNPGGDPPQQIPSYQGYNEEYQEGYQGSQLYGPYLGVGYHTQGPSYQQPPNHGHGGFSNYNQTFSQHQNMRPPFSPEEARQMAASYHGMPPPPPLPPGPPPHHPYHQSSSARSRGNAPRGRGALTQQSGIQKKKKTAAGDKQLPRSKVRCGWCKAVGHYLCDCESKIDQKGFICGCPICNVPEEEHNLDSCPFRNKRPNNYQYYAGERRHGKAPLKVNFDLSSIVGFEEDKWRPHTPEYARSLGRSHRTRFRYEEKWSDNQRIMDPAWAKWEEELKQDPDAPPPSLLHPDYISPDSFLPSVSKLPAASFEPEATEDQDNMSTVANYGTSDSGGDDEDHRTYGRQGPSDDIGDRL
ncbi:uncharacterized protein LY89DRAFT_733655 [Mollisia scopiformis]|uniref:Uncharacterized protein n=1 Tax=Mollisia scopiformis TaxID=149040 RepID=A0A194XCE5_MOLSC|nr:uncharacterized protein LY89DRAFT_733655 [Mollisia scopiformis]KUJ17834.1 hypothetical protein LY89DRAFT_733655 [Mollisia scopiformis]